ncbi:MAG: hypothetical protein ACFFB3_17050, partial [Candidatus Hodarchaeota archaeon]
MQRNLETLALRNAQEFVTPKTPLESLGTVLAILWLLTAIFPLDQSLRALFFFSMILILLLAVFQKLIDPEKGSAGQGFLQAGLRTFLFYMPIEFFGRGTGDLLEEWTDINVNYIEITTYKELEHWGVLLLLTLGFLATSFDRKLLRQREFSDFVLLICRGVFSSFLTLFFFVRLEFVSIEFSSNILFIGGLGSYILSGMGPSRLGIMQLAAAGGLPAVPQASRTEGLRDSFVLGGLMVLFFELALNWLEGAYWVETAIILVGGAIFIQVFLLKRGLNPLAFAGGADFLKNRIDYVGDSLQEFQEELASDSLNLTRRTVLSATDEVTLLKRGNETYSADRNAIILPLRENENETTLAVLGKGKITLGERAAADEKDQEVDGTTTLTIPRKDWEEIKASKALVPASLSDEAFAKIGSTKEKLSQQISSNLAQLKNVSLSRESFTSLIPTMSRYGIQDSKEGTSVSLPGLRVIEKKNLTYVKLPFLEVMDSRFGDLVSLPFLRVLSTKRVEVVHSPFFSVVETSKGSIVKIFGFTIREGDLNEAELRQTVEESLGHFAAARNQLGIGKEIESRLLLTSSTEGPKMRLLGGDQLINAEEELPETISDETMESYKEKRRRRREKRERRKREKR